MRQVFSRVAVLALLALLGSLYTLPAGAIVPPSRAVRVSLEEGIVATHSEERGILVEAIPRRGEGMTTFAKRMCSDARLGPQIAEANGGVKDLLVGIR